MQRIRPLSLVSGQPHTYFRLRESTSVIHADVPHIYITGLHLVRSTHDTVPEKQLLILQKSSVALPPEWIPEFRIFDMIPEN